MGKVNSELTEIELGPGHTAHRLITSDSALLSFNFLFISCPFHMN